MAAQPIRVLFVSHSGDWGGAEATLVSLLEGLDREAFAPSVVVPGPGHLRQHLEGLGIAVTEVDQPWWVFPRALEGRCAEHLAAGLLSAVSTLRGLIEERAIDVVVSHSLVIPAAALAARLAGRPHLWRVHELLGRNPELRTLTPLPGFLGSVAGLTDRVSAVSEAVRTLLAPHLGDGRVECLYNGLDVLEETVPRDPALFRGRRQVVAVVGSIAAGKGVLDLVPAAADVVGAHPDAGFLIVGEDGGARAAMQEAIAARGLSAAFRFTGFRRDAARLIAQSDLLVLPSLADSLPTVVLEAMAGGVAVVATRSGGAEELLVDGETGLLVPPARPAALADAVRSLLSRETERRAMGRRGRERLRSRFGRAQYVAGFARALRELASSAARPDAAAREAAGALAVSIAERASRVRVLHPERP